MKKILFITYTLFSFALKSQVTNGLVFHLDARDTNSYSGSGNTWNDLSGNNYNATINGATFNSNGKYFYFDGSNDYVNTNKTASQFGIYNTNYTMEAVFRVPNTGRGDNMVFGTNQTSTGRGLHNGTRGTRFYFGHYSQDISSGDIVSTNTWYHVTWTYSGSTMRIYRNAAQVAGGSKSRFIGTTNIWIGRHWRWFMGDIVYVKIYNRALSSQEITTNYNHYLNPNNAPTDIGLSSTSFNESISSGTTIGTLSTVDLDTSDSHTYSLVSGDGSNDADNGSFTVSGTSLISSGTFDFETDSSLNINLQVSDGTATYTEAFSLTVSDVNESPDDINLTNNIFKEGLLLHLDSGSPASFAGSGNTWNDLSGNNYNGTLMNSPSFSDDNGGMINLNGSTQWVELNSFAGVLSNSSSYTISIWFKSTETNASGQVYNNSIFSMHNSSGGNIFRIGAAPDASKGIYYNFGVGASEGRASSGTNLHDNQWHNVFISKNTSSQAQFYLDNNLVSTNNANTDGTPFNNVGKVSIGQEFDNASTSDHFQGSIPVVIIYNNVLTQNERTELYNSYKKRYNDGVTTQFGSSTISLTIDEGSSVGSLIGTLSATGQDAGETLTYSLISNGQSSSQHNSSFTVSGTQIITAAAIDYETTPTLNLNVQVSDGTTAYQKAFTVYVNDINDNSPTNIGLSTPTFAEDISSGSVIATLSATDADSSANSFTYSLISGNGSNDSDNSSFTVSGTSLVSSGTFDYETDPSLNIYLQVSDGSNTYAKSVTVSVTDANDAPTDITLGNTQIFENIAIGTQVATITATDVDVGQSHTFALVSSGNSSDDDNGSFTVSGTYLLTNAVIDYETKSSYNIFLSASDGTASTTKAFTITASDTLEPPTDVGFAGANIVTDGLVLHLDAGNSNSYSGSGNTWNDISGNSNHFTLYGSPTYNSNIKGGVINFDESNDYAKSNSTSVLNRTSYTKVAIYYPRTGTRNIVSGGNEATHAFWMAGSDNSIRGGHNSQWHTVNYSPGNMLNSWHYSAITFSSSDGFKLYYNGALVQTSGTTQVTNGNGIIRVGANKNSQNLFEGKIS